VNIRPACFGARVKSLGRYTARTRIRLRLLLAALCYQSVPISFYARRADGRPLLQPLPHPCQGRSPHPMLTSNVFMQRSYLANQTGSLSSTGTCYQALSTFGELDARGWGRRCATDPQVRVVRESTICPCKCDWQADSWLGHVRVVILSYLGKANRYGARLSGRIRCCLLCTPRTATEAGRRK
jgi:hypothetical protein